MKRNTIYSLFLGVFIVALSYGNSNAQTYADVVEAFNQATDLATNGNNRGAIQAFERVITLSDQVGTPEAGEIKTRAQNQIPQLYFLIARDLYNAGNLVPAAEAFIATVEQANKYGNQQIAQRSQAAIPQIYLTAGNRHLQNDEFQAALDMYDKALSHRPSYAAAFYQKGLVYRRQENLDEALNYFDRAIQVGASTNERNIVENATGAARNFLLLRGVDRSENRQYRQATELLRQALQYDDQSADVYYRLAEVYNKQALWAQAIESANKALEFEQGGRADRAKIYLELGTALMNSGNRDAAACEAFQNAAFGQFRALAEHEMEHTLKCNSTNRR